MTEHHSLDLGHDTAVLQIIETDVSRNAYGASLFVRFGVLGGRYEGCEFFERVPLKNVDREIERDGQQKLAALFLATRTDVSRDSETLHRKPFWASLAEENGFPTITAVAPLEATK